MEYPQTQYKAYLIFILMWIVPKIQKAKTTRIKSLNLYLREEEYIQLLNFIK